MNHERFSDGDDALLGTRYRTFQHQEIIFDDAIMREAAHRRNGLGRDIRLGRCVGIIRPSADTIDLLINLRAVVIAICNKAQERITCNGSANVL